MDVFKGKRVVVTGAGRGIGYVLVQKLVFLEAKVIAITLTEANRVKLTVDFPDIKTYQLDISNWMGTENIIKQIGNIDFLVNNAGISETKSISNTDRSSYQRIMNTNLAAAFNISRLAAQNMKMRKISGAIVNVSSINSVRGFPQHSVNAMSKGGLDQLTRALSVELGPFNIRANSVNPGNVCTDTALEHHEQLAKDRGMTSDQIRQLIIKRIPIGHLLEPDGVCDAILFLLSNLASGITGTTLVVDGGFDASL